MKKTVKFSIEKSLENPMKLTNSELLQSSIGKDKHMTTWASGCKS